MTYIARLRCIIAGLFFTCVAEAQVPDTTFWIPNGPVDALLLHDTTVIAGGDFDQVSPYTGSFVRVSEGHPEADLSLFKVNGPVYAMCLDSWGFVYVGGNFTRAGGQPVQNLFRLTPAGNFDASFLPVVNGPVYSLFNFKNDIYIGGDFNQVNGEARGNSAAFNTVFDTLTDYDAHTNGPIYCMALDSNFDCLIIGGDFTVVGQFAPPYLAKVDMRTGIPFVSGSVPWSAQPNCNGPVYDIAMAGNYVYFAGEFTMLGTTTRRGLAKIHTATGVMQAENASINGSVYCMELIDTCIYFGGSFTTVNSQSHQRLACVSISFLSQNWTPSANNVVRVMAVLDSSYLVVGGDFTMINSDSCGRGAMITFRDSGYAAAWDPKLNKTARSVATDLHGRIYFGGDFFGAGGEYRNNICAFSVNSGIVTALNPNANNAVHCMALDGDSLYFTGDFSNVSGVARNRAAAIDLNSGTLLAFNPGVNGLVRSIAFSDSAVFMGGNFTQLGGLPRLNIGKVSKYTSASTSWNPGCLGTVNSILATSNWIYVAGYYSTIAGVTRLNLARLQPLSGIADPNWICDVDDGIYHAEFYSGKIALGGWFNTVNTQAVSDFAFVDPTTFQVTVPDFTTDGYVRTFTTYGDDFFISGSFDLVNSVYQPQLIAYDQGDDAVNTWSPYPSAMPVTLQANASQVFVGGAMSYANGVFRPYFQVLDVQWITSVEESPDTPADAFTVYPVPASDLVTVVSEKATSYSITDVSGKIVQSGSLDNNGGQSGISIASLADGLYILTLWSDNVTPASRPIIKN